MFENYVGEKTKPLPKWAAFVVGAAIAIHIVAVGALVIKSFWTINKLGLPEGEVTLGAPPPPPPPPPAGSKTKKIEKKTLKKVEEVAQVDKDKPKPEEVKNTEEDTEEDGVEGGVEGGVKGGVVGGVLGGVEGGVLGGTGSGPPPPPKNDPPKIVPQRALEASRISGTTQIQPPNDVNIQIRRSGKTAVAVFKMCLSATGRISKVNKLKSSGFAKYDSKIQGEMRRWKYKPFRVNGKAVPVCTSVTFIYKPGA